MAIVLEVTSAGSPPTRTPIEAGRNSFRARPGARYQVIDDSGAKIDQNVAIRRVGNDLLVDGLPEGKLIELDGFFSRCTPDNSCALSMQNLGGTGPAGEVTPATEPVAALKDGSFLMYTTQSVAGILPAAPEAAEAGSWFKPVGYTLAALAVAGAAGGGGGGGGGGGSAPVDTTPPAAPGVTSGAASKSARPVISGTAEPGSQVNVFLDIDGAGFTVRYLTTADASGNWTVNTANPAASGTMHDLASSTTVPVRVLAVDAANNQSTATTYQLTIDNVAPALPTIAAVAGDNIVNGAEKTAGVTLAGTAEPGSTVAVTWGLVTHTAVAASDGSWTSVFAPADVPADNPASTISVIATDAAGNASAAASRTVVVDSTSTVVIAPVTSDGIINFTERAAGVIVSGSAKPNSAVQLSWGAIALHNVTADGAGNWTSSYSAGELASLGQGSVTLTARATDTLGNVGTYNLAVLIDTVAPTAPSIASIPESAGGGLNAAEAPDGTLVNVNLAGTGAAAGDTLIVHWGGQNISQVLTAGQLGTTIAVTVPQTSIANQGNGTVNVTASINDAQGNIGSNSTATVVQVDTVNPTVAISSSASGTATGPVTFTFTFSEAVSGFDASDVVVTGGTKGAVTGSGSTYQLIVTPATNSVGNITVALPAAAATDTASNSSAAATTFNQPFNTSFPPTVTITDNVTGTATGPVIYTFTFSEAVTGFDATDVTVVNGTKGAVTGSGTTYQLTVTPTPNSTGSMTVDVGAGAATGTTSGLGNVVASQNVQLFNTDVTSPTVAITDNTPGTAAGPVIYTFTFSEPVTGFDASDVAVTNGTKGAVTGSGTTYQLTVTPNAGSGTMTVDVGAGAGLDAGGNGNTAATQSTQAYNIPTAPTVAITDDTLGTATGAVVYTFTFSEAVTGFAAGDVTVVNGTKGAVTGSGAVYQLTVTPTSNSEGTMTVDVGAGLATGTTSGLGNAAAPQASQAYDTQFPAQTLLSFTVNDDVLPTTGNIAHLGTTNDTSPQLTLTLNSVLGTGETLTLFKSTDGGAATSIQTAITGASSLTFTDTVVVGSAHSYSYTASVADAAGNTTLIDLNGGTAGLNYLINTV